MQKRYLTYLKFHRQGRNLADLQLIQKFNFFLFPTKVFAQYLPYLRHSFRCSQKDKASDHLDLKFPPLNY